MKKTLLIVLILSTSVLLAGAESFTLATYPFGDGDNIYAAFSTLTDFLSEETGDSFRLIITRDYEELSDRIKDGTVDFAWIGSANYVKTRGESDDAVYLATYREWSPDGRLIQPYYQSVILCLKSSPYRDLADTEGTRFAFTSPDSTSGYAYPRLILQKGGIDPDEFYKTLFYLGRHPHIIEALVAGSIDVGACSDGTYYNALSEYGDIFRILEMSDPIPLDAVVAVKHISSDKQRDVRRALLSIGTDHIVNDSIKRYLGWPAAGFEEKSDSFYDSVEKAMALINRDKK